MIQAGAHKDAALEDAIAPLLAAVGDVDLARYDASDDAQQYFFSVLRFLVEAGVDVDRPNNDCITPLIRCLHGPSGCDSMVAECRGRCKSSQCSW